MHGKYDRIKICGIASIASPDVIDNMEFATAMGDRRAKKQVKLTGIRKRHVVVKGQRASDMCCQAAESLFRKLNWERDSIRVLVFVTQTEDVLTPSTAMIIQKRLGIGQDCIAFDVNLGCTGYVSGLQIISALLSNTGGRGLLVVGDGCYSDKRASASSDALLFGDAGTATALEVGKGSPLYYSQKTDGSRYQLLYTDITGKMTMDGNAILLFSLNEVVNSVKEIKSHFDISEDKIDYYVFHQAQKLIIDAMANECNVQKEKVLTSYEEYANTSTASIPLTICHNVNQLKEKQKVTLLLCGFGVGLAWSNVILTLETENILPVEISDYVYGDIC